MAVAEMGAAQQVLVSQAKRRRLREWQREQAEAAEAERQRQEARKERGGRVTGKKLAAGVASLVAGAGLAYTVHRSRGMGGFGGLQVNMAARMRALTATPGARHAAAPEDDQGLFQ